MTLAVAVLVWVAATALYLGLDPLFGWLDEIRSTLLWIGADGGRLEHAGPALFASAAGRASLLAPVVEELLFRGSVFGWLRRRANGPVTIAVTAVLFAGIHQMPVVLPLTALFGLGAGWLREHTGSVTPCLALHVLNNVALITVAYLLTVWQVSGPPAE